MSGQLAFDLAPADHANRAHRDRQRLAYLPDGEAEVIAWAQDALRRHHATMLEGNVERALELRKQIDEAAEKLHGARFGMFDPCDPDAGGHRLTRAIAYDPASGAEPLWGQPAEFIATSKRYRVRMRIKTRGIFESLAHFGWSVPFGTHAIDLNKPFISPTGFYSFHYGVYSAPAVGMSYPAWVVSVVEAYVALPAKAKRAGELTGLGGKLVPIDQEHREWLALDRADEAAVERWREKWHPRPANREGKAA